MSGYPKTMAMKDILATLDALLVEKTGEPSQPHELGVEVSVWMEERERYGKRP